jgi:hypothetical protein
VRCIFCLEEKVGNEEHVFPLAIGGCLMTKRVCEGCNSKLGTSIDAPLTDHLLVVVRRAELGIAGRGGVPDAFRQILGDSVLASDPSHRLRATVDPNTGKLDIRTVPSSSPQQLPDGTTAKRLVLDERDIDGLGDIIQKIRRRNNLSPLSPEEIDQLKQNARDNLAVIENPKAILNIRIDTHRFMRGIVKICYELAFLWLVRITFKTKWRLPRENSICSTRLNDRLAV